ncbi:hypothetical protein AOL_s00043g322 [Orbilia oligospora ATCC 24927]|uniref:Uncharacterized protein n=2 Tax=Orbilia oligospora TaxID=2813651 RepID=G1X3P8_ARTOA|nr:hypothetical protein AOL_s00043g322 [Orbilia oligospora ATCC 24927]EGX52179.1 hypothetical protein AOL_s00043g322 [Orbilia oligospora ATCC 24927]KAF3289413.1 hypothetical protein TWF970_003192 [Orbilia oligospora]
MELQMQRMWNVYDWDTNLETYPRNIDARLSLDLRYAYAARQYGSIGGRYYITPW